MATKLIRRTRALSPLPPLPLLPVMPDVARIASELENNPQIERYSVVVDKRKGIVKATAKDFNGRTMTKEILAAGLEQVTRYNPSDKDARDAGIRALLSKGLTQQETADKLGCSQALVSNVARQGLANR